ncbi:MAG TPA: glutathione binding-like protein [Pseudomonadales bacterium]
MEYLSIEEGRSRSGLRLVLTTGVPGPWGELAKYILHVKGLDFLALAQLAGQPNEALHDWTGQTSAPVAVWNDEPPRTSWESIAWLAERLQSEPCLIPADPGIACRTLGIARAMAGECGFGWYRRIMILQASMQRDATRETSERLGAKYGYNATEAVIAPGKVAAYLQWFDHLLAEQEAKGSHYFVGHDLTLADLAWAAFAIMVRPLPERDCPMHPAFREAYELRDPAILPLVTPRLLAHRDYVYQHHLALPLDF